MTPANYGPNEANEFLFISAAETCPEVTGRLHLPAAALRTDDEEQGWNILGTSSADHPWKVGQQHSTSDV